jgi:protein-L-isoaspartate(D-aspartate) O-methyltransferase
MDFAQARFNMVEQQVRPWEVLDASVLSRMASLPRDEFVPSEYRRLAYADIQIPLGEGQVMMPPRVEGRMLQALQVGPADRVLEVGTGSGFVTALLASLGRHVTSVEIFESLHTRARARLRDHGIHNVSPELGDAVRGWPANAPYDAIAVTGSMPAPDGYFERQLGLGGRLFVIVGEAPAMEARLITRTGEDQWSTESLFETVIPRLVGATERERFVL